MHANFFEEISYKRAAEIFVLLSESEKGKESVFQE